MNLAGAHTIIAAVAAAVALSKDAGLGNAHTPCVCACKLVMMPVWQAIICLLAAGNLLSTRNKDKAFIVL